MKTRGRDSAESRAIVFGGFGERPEPPRSLSARQKDIWREVVGSEDPNFFSTAVTRGLLAGYCRSQAMMEEITAVIEASAGVWIDDTVKHNRLLQMRDRELKAMTLLAGKLRLTNQSRYVPHAAGRAAAKAVKVDPPWAKSA